MTSQEVIPLTPQTHNEQREAIEIPAERSEYIDVMQNAGMLREAEYSKLVPEPPVTLGEFQVIYSENAQSRDQVAAELNELHDHAQRSQGWLDTLEAKSWLGRFVARGDIRYHKEIVDRYQEAVGGAEDHSGYVEQAANTHFGEQVRGFLQNASTENPESVRDFVTDIVGKPEDGEDIDTASALADIPPLALAQQFDKRHATVQENHAIAAENLQTWTTNVLSEFDLSPAMEKLLEKRLWTRCSVSIADPLVAPKGRFDKIKEIRVLEADGTRPPEELEANIKQQLRQWIAEDTGHVQSLPTTEALTYEYDAETANDPRKQRVRVLQKTVELLQTPHDADPNTAFLYAKARHNLTMTAEIMSNPKTELEHSFVDVGSLQEQERAIRSYLDALSAVQPLAPELKTTFDDEYFANELKPKIDAANARPLRTRN
jgi:hypothetical protein